MRVDLDIKTKISLNYFMVLPILLYNAEVWFIYDCKEIDTIRVKLCMNILGVRQQTQNDAVLGELGIFCLLLFQKKEV
jgi:hypothetical protein